MAGTDGALGPEHRLAVYGTLAPGRANAHVLADIGGHWTTGTVRGRLVQLGWGAAQGYPGILLGPEGDLVEVHVLVAENLPAHWERLDAFEGSGYRRRRVTVQTADGAVEASIYEAVAEA
ncbi:MAG: gamma-glutamylcyclotransferase family protein [Pseudomonadota bacterium]